MDEIFFQPKNLSKEGFEEGKLIDPNKVVPPSSGGAAANPLAPKQLSYNQSKEAEAIFKTYLKKPFDFHLKTNSAELTRNLNDVTLFVAFVKYVLLFFVQWL